MTGDEFLSLAIELFTKNRSPSEALCRTIVSRAYYGAYHLVRAYVAGLGFQSMEGHKLLADSLKHSDEPSLIEAGDKLATLAWARRRADYDLAATNVATLVQSQLYLKDHIERAHRVKDLLKLAANEQAKTAVKLGIDSFLGRSGRNRPR